MLKPGLLTSELWLIVATGLNAGTEWLTTNQKVNLSTLLAAMVYAVCRSAVKMKVPAASTRVDQAVSKVLAAAAAGVSTAQDPTPPPQPPVG